MWVVYRCSQFSDALIEEIRAEVWNEGERKIYSATLSNCIAQLE
jgi:hypothetical protein